MECPICGQSSGEEFRAKYTLAAKCGNPRCGHIYAKHPEEAQGVQEHSDPEADYQAYRKRNENLIRFWRKTGFLTEQAGLLDIGAGGGHVLRSIREKMPGVAITCIEADPQSAEYLSRMGFDVVNGLDDARGQYDAILLIEVIEHVNEPVPFLAACKKLLAPRGEYSSRRPVAKREAAVAPPMPMIRGSTFSSLLNGLCVYVARRRGCLTFCCEPSTSCIRREAASKQRYGGWPASSAAS